MADNRFTMFYDGRCPLCMREIRHLRRWDTRHRVNFIDINSADFSERYPQIDRERAMAVLHAQLPDGRVIIGLDVTVETWSRVGKGHWVRWLRWRPIRPFSNLAYRFFARHRDRVAQLLTGERRCPDDHCK
ncbi:MULTISPECIES: thiol-disulfide oxidoreductase DCC family protein [Microbulbifer]|uniref:thiol-disulfide oxidoreductase DCC family protein n=1 Tax=Microbulbifer TaxID=48073 RepID=UPI001F34AB11|nr:DUF393 domain-containing protein [Microbulbifer zhoushanensis]